MGRAHLAGWERGHALARDERRGPAGRDRHRILLLTTDARAAHELLVGKALDVGELLDWESTPLMFSFLDLDRNRFYVSQDG